MISWYEGRREKPRDHFRSAPITDLNRIARCMLDWIWSPIVFKGGSRLEENFIESFWCALDFEDPAFSLEDASNAFCDMRHIIGTTKSHGIAKGAVPACDRFRVLLEWSEPIAALRLYRWNMRRIFERYPADKSCVDGARFLYPCREIISINADPEAFTEPVHYEVPESFENERLGLAPERVKALRAAGAVPSFASYWLAHAMPLGKRNTYCYGIAKDLTYSGFELAEIRERILDSPTYRGASLAPRLLREIDEAIRNGARAAGKAMQ